MRVGLNVVFLFPTLVRKQYESRENAARKPRESGWGGCWGLKHLIRRHVSRVKAHAKRFKESPAAKFLFIIFVLAGILYLGYLSQQQPFPSREYSLSKASNSSTPLGFGAKMNGTLKPGYCTDGTASGLCSLDKPLYCTKDSLLVRDCSTCGCSGGLSCTPGGDCAKPGLGKMGANAKTFAITEAYWCQFVDAASVEQMVGQIKPDANAPFELSHLMLIFDSMKKQVKLAPPMTRDPQKPLETVKLSSGSVEDQAVLEASFVKAAGGQVKFMISKSCNHAFAAVLMGDKAAYAKKRQEIAAHYSLSNVLFYSLADDSGQYWIVADPAGGAYLGDVSATCKNATDIFLTKNC